MPSSPPQAVRITATDAPIRILRALVDIEPRLMS